MNLENLAKTPITEDVTAANLQKVNQIIERLYHESIAEGDEVSSIVWTGRTRNYRGTWYELKVVNQYGSTTGWTDGGVTDWFVNFVEV